MIYVKTSTVIYVVKNIHTRGTLLHALHSAAACDAGIYFRAAFVVYVPAAGDGRFERFADLDVAIARTADAHFAGFGFQVARFYFAAAADADVQVFGFAGQFNRTAAADADREVVHVVKAVLAEDFAAAANAERFYVRKGDVDFDAVVAFDVFMVVDVPGAVFHFLLDVVNDVLLGFDHNFLRAALGQVHGSGNAQSDAIYCRKANFFFDDRAFAFDAVPPLCVSGCACECAAQNKCKECFCQFHT